MNTTITVIRYLDRAIDAACDAANSSGNWQTGERLERAIDSLERRYDWTLPRIFGV